MLSKQGRRPGACISDAHFLRQRFLESEGRRHLAQIPGQVSVRKQLECRVRLQQEVRQTAHSLCARLQEIMEI